MSSNSPLSGALIRQSTEAVGNFLRWVAELIVSRNWFSLLILIAIASLFLFNPSSGFAFKAFVIDATTLKGYALGFWLGEAGLLLAALAIAVKTMPRVVPASKADTADRKAIKGLRPFDTDDAEIFAQLQRQRNLRECLESITSGPFRFGILHGESGCGKTSFLQAGVLPQLAVDSTQAGERAEGERRKGEWGKGERAVGVYVRFSDQEPVRTIATAIADQLEIPLSWLLPEGAGSTDLMAVLQKLADSAEQPLILLLDQFEQFFVHHKRKASRQDFIQSLAAWYKGDRASPIRIVVAVRSDLMYQLDEIHQALGYSLAPQEVFRLEKFTPAEASRVLEAIAQTEGLAFNREFVTELAQAELADREEGLISPVDLQILCWMIERQTADELRAFNRSAFEKFGGVEGLLLRFLERTLEARVTEGQRQAVVKVLLALTDLERQVRAGMLTAPELREKLKGSAKPEEVNEAVAWLVRGDVRLITPQQKEGEVAYELAHERLIPALMRQAGKELSAVDQANRLMDKRVNEWLGNHCDKRYFFGPRELWLLRQQQPYLVWGAKREQKEKLLRLSRRRVYGGFAALLAAVMISSSFVGWRNFTTSGQIWNIQSQLSGLLKETSSGAIVADAAVAYAKNGQWDKGLAIAQQRLRDKDRTTFVVKCSELVVRSTSIDKKSQFLSDLKVLILAIKDKRSKSDALSAIASAYVSLEDSVQAKAVLSETLTVAKAIQSDYSKSTALSAIASAAVSLEDSVQAKAVLSETLMVAKAIQSDSSKSTALSAIVSAAVSLEDSVQAKAVVSETLTVAKAIQSDSSKSTALSAIASATVSLEDSVQVKAVVSEALTVTKSIQDDYSKSTALSEIASAAVSLEDTAQAKAVLSEALTVTKSIQDDYLKSTVLGEIASAAVSLEDTAQAKAVLSETLTVAKSIQDDRSKPTVLSAIASAAVSLEDTAQAKAVLSETLTVTKSIQDDSSKLSALSEIASAYVSLEDTARAKALLSEALTVAKSIQDDSSKLSALSEIASAYVSLEDTARAKALLSEALTVAKSIQNDRYKPTALSEIASVTVSLEDTAQAKALLSEVLTVTKSIQSDSSKSNALSEIASAAVSLEDTAQAKALLSEVLTVTKSIQDDRSKSYALSEIASVTVSLEDTVQAKAVVSEALTVAKSIQSDSYKSDALREITTAGIALADEKLVEELVAEILVVAHREKTSVPMVIIANHYAKESRWAQALHALSKAEKREKAVGLSKLLTILAEKEQPALIEGAVVLPKDQKGITYSGQSGNYTLQVKLQSPDETCKKRADWWEVMTPEGKLIKRQPMTTVRKDVLTFNSDELVGVDIESGQIVLIRAHFNGRYLSEKDLLVDDKLRGRGAGVYDKSGYTDQALKGSIDEGFDVVRISENFAPWLKEQEPLPDPKACSDK